LAVLKLYIILRLPRREKRVYSRCYASPLRTQNPPSPRGWNLWLGKFNKSASNTVPRFPQRYSSPAILSIVTRDILRAFVSRVNSQRMNDHFSFFRVFSLAYVRFCTMPLEYASCLIVAAIFQENASMAFSQSPLLVIDYFLDRFFSKH